MAYRPVTVKPDLIFNEKVLYICTTRGCGNDISEFPSAEKNPPPRKCKLCMNKATREEIEQEYDKINHS
jgi:hypothetical protein